MKDFEPGDKVRIVRKATPEEFGNSWLPPMDAAVGETGTVREGPISWRYGKYYRLYVQRIGKVFDYPACVLEPPLYGNEEDG